jgi:2-dehydro-3-deoxyphosphogluconate aldolase/(4S)-4-hydroxy-2-oxoglutarate aldolase
VDTAGIIGNTKLIVILRHIPLDFLNETAQALKTADVQVVEVAMNSADAAEQIQLLREYGFCVGAGTILHEKEAKKAVHAGARFLFSPVRCDFFLPFCRERKVIGIAGGLSPMEIYTLFREGSDFIKLFPSVPLGPDYLRHLMAPFPSLRLIPTGGVTLSLAKRFLSSGAAAVAVGKEIVDPELIRTKRFGQVRRRAQSFVTLIHKLGHTEVLDQR